MRSSDGYTRGHIRAEFWRGLGGGALVVEGEEVGEDLLGGEVGGPAVGGEDGFVEGAMGVGEPVGARVVEVGEGAFLEFFLRGVGRVEPGVAEGDERAGGVGDGFDAGVVGFGGLGTRRPREGEGKKTGFGGESESAFNFSNLSPRCSGPSFVDRRVHDAEEIIICSRKDIQRIVREDVWIQPYK